MNRQFIFYFIIILLLSSVFAIELTEVTKEGVTETFTKGDTKYFNVVESASIRIGNPRSDSLEKHTLKAIEIKDNLINLTIDKKKSLTMSVGQTRRIDVDKDNVFDISLNLINIRSGAATILFTELDLKQDIKTISEDNNTNTIENKVQENVSVPKVTPNISTNVTAKELTPNLSNNNLFVMIGFGLCALIIIFIIGYLIYKKRNS